MTDTATVIPFPVRPAQPAEAARQWLTRARRASPAHAAEREAAGSEAGGQRRRILREYRWHRAAALLAGVAAVVLAPAWDTHLAPLALTTALAIGSTLWALDRRHHLQLFDWLATPPASISGRK
jgi:hypothetical protein